MSSQACKAKTNVFYFKDGQVARAWLGCHLSYGHRGSHETTAPNGDPWVFPNNALEGLMEWRVGRSVGRTVYEGDQLVGLMDTPELADEVVEAVNLLRELRRS